MNSFWEYWLEDLKRSPVTTKYAVNAWASEDKTYFDPVTTFISKKHPDFRSTYVESSQVNLISASVVYPESLEALKGYMSEKEWTNLGDLSEQIKDFLVQYDQHFSQLGRDVTQQEVHSFASDYFRKYFTTLVTNSLLEPHA